MIDDRNGIHTLDGWQRQEQPESTADADLPDRPRVKDVAKWLGLHQNTIYGLIHKGEIPCKVVGKRTYIFEKATLLEWAKPEGVQVIDFADKSREREIARSTLEAIAHQAKIRERKARRKERRGQLTS